MMVLLPAKNLQRRRRICSMQFWTLLFLNSIIALTNGCQFFPLGEFMKFVRIPEDFPKGELVLSVEVHHRHNVTLHSLDKNDDAKYFKLVELSPSMVEIRLARSLKNLVDNVENPQSILKFQIVCFAEQSQESIKDDDSFSLIEQLPNKLVIQLYIEDVNNQVPQFVDAPYKVSIDEATPVGQRIFSNINAIDLDKPNTANSDVYFTIIDGNQEAKFGLENSKPASLVLRKPLDYDVGECEFRLTIMAKDRGQPVPLSATTEVLITVADSDDRSPIFSSAVYRTQIKEFYPLKNVSIRHAVPFPVPIHAFDQDFSLNATIEYDILSGNDMNYFELDERNGTLYLIREIDRELLPSNTFEMQIRARQTNSKEKFGLSKIILDVLDQNDNFPIFEVQLYNISIMENLPNGFSVLQVLANDADINENAEFAYKLEDPSRAFSINSKTGWLTVRDSSRLDREKINMFNLRVFADEKVPNIALESRNNCTISIMLLDANDNQPLFQPSNLYKFHIPQNSEVGSVVGQVIATDPDLSGNGEISYEVQKSNMSNEIAKFFQIDEKSGYIFLLERPLPKSQYTILVQAYDNPVNLAERRTSLAVVQIDLVKADSTYAPAFINAPYEFWVGNQVSVGTSVGQVKVNNFDPKHTVFDLLHGYYDGVPVAIEEKSGVIAVVDELIKYTRNRYEFEAYVTDSRNTLTTNVTIHIVDPVDIMAAENSQEPVELSVKENIAGAVIANLKGILISSVRGNRVLEFVLVNGRDNFAIASDGTLYTLKNLDREAQARHVLTVISQARGGTNQIHQIVVNVADENDNLPRFSRQEYQAHVRENAPAGTPVFLEDALRVIDLDEGINAEFQIELRGNGSDRFRIDPSNGKVYVGNSQLDREEKGLYVLDVVAMDSHNSTSHAKLRITVTDTNDNAPIFMEKIIIDPPALDDSIGARELLKSSSSQPVSVEITNTEPIVVPETIEVGKVIARVAASDRDLGDNSRIFYRIVSENESTGDKIPLYLSDKQYLFSRSKNKHFQIDKDTGKISVAKPLKPNTNYALNISASDRGGLRSYTGIMIYSIDVNDHSPTWLQFSYKFDIVEGIYAHGEIGKITANDPDSGINGEVSYKIRWKDPGNQQNELPFSIDKNSGVLFVEGTVDREAQSKYLLEGIASDCKATCKESKTSTVELVINILDRNESPPLFENFTTTFKMNDQEIPIYRTVLEDSIKIGTWVISVYAKDTDDPLVGNGVVIYHLANNQQVFQIDSKNGSIFTAARLSYDKESFYNTTVIASDLGRPSLSSTALVLVRLINTKSSQLKNERLFEKDIYTYELSRKVSVPVFITKFNVTQKQRNLKTEFDLIGMEDVISKFRIDPRGELYLTKHLDVNKTYEFIVRGYNSVHTKKFDIRQKAQPSDQVLESNEMLVKIRMVSPAMPFRTTLPPLRKQILSTVKSKFNASEPFVLKGPKLVQGIASSATRKPSNSSELDKKLNSHHKGNLYAGEMAILILSSVILLGGLTAAISVACVKRSNYTRPRQRPQLPPPPTAVPVDIHMQKQVPSRILSTRPLIFPMALPNRDGILSEQCSETTSDTYTDAGDMFRDSNNDTFALQARGYAICPDCRKLRKPLANMELMAENRDFVGSFVDRGPLKQVGRSSGLRDISLQSSNDSGIDGSDQCNCCRAHNFSSNGAGRSFFIEQYEDSLMPPIPNPRPISFKKKRISSHKNNTSNFDFSFSSPLNMQPKNVNNKSSRVGRAVIL